jgi:ABC-2 type transport system permease protein
VKALVHAEVLKLRSTRMPAWLLLATLGFVVVTVLVNVPKVGAKDAPVSLDDPGLLAGTVGSSFGAPMVTAALLGVLAVTQEFRYGTITSTYLVEPRRMRVLVAKWLSIAIAGAVVTASTLALSVPFSIALIRSRDGDANVGAQFWQVVVAAVFVIAAYGVMGVALGALVRNQIVAAVGVLVWMLAVEQIVIPAFPTVGHWMPGASAFALLQSGPIDGLEDTLPSAPVAGLVLAGYTAAAVVLAVLFTPRRDVL